MDNILDKFGLYDFFGLLIPGMYFLFVLDFLNIPQIMGIQYPANEGIMVVAFLVFSYLMGTLIQEVASLLDRKFKWRDEAKGCYLNKSGKILSGKELQEIQGFLKGRFGKIDFENSEDNETLFKKMKASMENQDKMEKADKYDAIYAMSRDLFVGNIFLFIVAVANIVINLLKSDFSVLSVMVCLVCGVSIPIFYFRAREYAKKRVRTIVRQYMRLRK